MNYIDIFLLVFLLLTAVKGYSKGFVVEVFSLIAFFVGLFLAIEFTSPVAVKFFSGSDYFELISIGVFVSIFVGLTIVINMVGKVIKKAVDFSMLGMFDNVLGAILGMFKFALIASILIWMFDSIGLDLPSKEAESSRLLPYIRPIGPKAFTITGDIIPFFKDVFDSVDSFDRKGKVVEVISRQSCYFT